MKGVLAPLLKLIVFTVVTAMATAMLGFTIANSTFGDKVTYSARFTDATGVLVGDDVRIAGVRVGTVAGVRIVDRRIAEVSFTVNGERELPASVTASVLYRNLIGQRYLALEQGAGPVGEMLAPGGVIPVERTTPPLNLTVLFNGFRPLLVGLDPEQVNQLSFEIVQVLQGQGGTVQSLLASTSSLTNELADRDEVIGSVIDNLNTVLDTVNSRDQELSGLILQLQRLVSGLSADREPIGDAIESLDTLATTTGGLVAEARPDLRADIDQLGLLAGNLNDSEQVLDRTLQYFPEKLSTLTRTGSYGSWFNFFVCGLAGKTTLLGDQTYEFPLSESPAARCRA